MRGRRPRRGTRQLLYPALRARRSAPHPTRRHARARAGPSRAFAQSWRLRAGRRADGLRAAAPSALRAGPDRRRSHRPARQIVAPIARLQLWHRASVGALYRPYLLRNLRAVCLTLADASPFNWSTLFSSALSLPTASSPNWVSAVRLVALMSS